MTDLATPPRKAPQPPASTGKVGRLRSAVRSTKRTGKDWLDRPMTSWHLILAIFVLLLGFGLLMVLSASSISSYRSRSGSAFSTFENQAVYALIGLGGFVFAARVSPKLLRRMAFPAVLTSLLLLAAVFIPHVGIKLNGARSWLGFGSISFQPSELAKVALLLWMAHVLAARRHTLRSLKALLFPALPIFALMVGLIMLQPDLGTTISLALVFFAVLWFSGSPMWVFAVLTAVGLAGVTYLATSAGYRAQRVLSFLDPTNPNYTEFTYQLRQGYYGMGHGGLFGVGLGQSMVKWSWLPNADSDFIFAIIGEELGLIGTGILLLLFGLLAYTGLRIARRNVDPFIKIVAASCTVWLVGQAAINIGYVVGLLPVTGIPLPMISAGGTSLVVTMLVFGLLANFARREPQAAAALDSQGPGWLARFLGVGKREPAEPKERKPRRRREVGVAEKPTRSGRRRGVAVVEGEPARSGRRRGVAVVEGEPARSGRRRGAAVVDRPTPPRADDPRSGAVRRRPESVREGAKSSVQRAGGLPRRGRRGDDVSVAVDPTTAARRSRRAAPDGQRATGEPPRRHPRRERPSVEQQPPWVDPSWAEQPRTGAPVARPPRSGRPPSVAQPVAGQPIPGQLRRDRSWAEQQPPIPRRTTGGRTIRP